MAVVTRIRKGGKKTYYVKFVWHDRTIWEHAGHDLRVARSTNAQRLREVREGCYDPELRTVPTFREYSEKWLDKRTNRNREEDRRVFGRHVLDKAWFVDAKIDTLRAPQLRRLLEEWRATVSEATGAVLSTKSVANIYGLVRSVFLHAAKSEVIVRDPCDSLARKEVPRKGRKRRGVYALDAVRSLLTSDAVHPAARVFAAIALLTGAREGEVCGLRWSDWDLGPEPLTCLTIERQYEGRALKTDDTRHAGEHARRVPVHPTLAAALKLWWEHDWALVYGRSPALTDAIVPRKGGDPHTKSSAYKLWRRACVAAGVTNVSLHSTRHTFITLARRRGMAEVVEKITHNAAGAIIDQYTHREWNELCAAVESIDLNARTMVSSLVTHAPRLLVEQVSAPVSIPGASTITTDNDRSVSDRDHRPKQLKTSVSSTVTDAQWDARHQRQHRTSSVVWRAYFCAPEGRHFDAPRSASHVADCPSCGSPARELGAPPPMRTSPVHEARS